MDSKDEKFDSDDGPAADVNGNLTGSRYKPSSRWLSTQSPGWAILAGSLLLTALLFGALFVWITPGYETNDDLCMQLIASGFYDGHPSEYLVFTNFLIGWPVRLLFSAWPGWNWYVTYLVTVQYAAMTAVCFVAVYRSRRWLVLGMFLGFFSLVEIRMLVDLQFTTTAFLAGAAGILLLTDSLRLLRAPNWTEAAAGLAFVGMTAMIREAVVPMLALIAGPLLLERVKFIGWTRLLSASAAAACVVFSLVGANRWYYQRDPAWREFCAYNDLRGQIHGTPLTNSIPRVAASVGWSRNDGELFRRFYYAEPELYASAGTMRRLLDHLRAGSRVSSGLLKKHFLKCVFLPRGFPRDSAFFMKLALLNALLCVLFAGHYAPRYCLTLLASYGMCVMLSVYLRTTARLPERVAITMPLFMNLMCLYWSMEVCSSRAFAGRTAALTKWLPTFTRPQVIRWVRRACVVACAVFYVPCLFHFSEGWWYGNVFNRKVRVASRTIFQPISALLPPGQKPILVPMPSDQILEACLAYQALSGCPSFFMIPYGWLTHSPIFQHVLDQHNLRPFSLSLVDREDVFFLMNDSWCRGLQTFYWEHYRQLIQFATAGQTDQMREYRESGLHLYRAYSCSENPAHAIISSPANAPSAIELHRLSASFAAGEILPHTSVEVDLAEKDPF